MKTKSPYRSLLAAFLLGIAVVSPAQVTFQKVYPTNYERTAFDVLPASDGNYFIAGMTLTSIINDADVYLIKTNSLGDTLWTRKYGGIKPDCAYSIAEAYDGNYMVLGYTQSFGGGDYDTWLLKINKSNGDTMWTKRYGSWGNDQGKEIIRTDDGNFMITGFTNGTGGSNYHSYLTKINPSGVVIWSQNYGGPGIEYGNSVKQCADGGYIMLGQTYSYGAGGGDAYLIRTNSTGDTTWTKTYGGSQMDEGMYVLAHSDGGYVFIVRDSSTNGNDVDVQIIRTNANGGIIWDKNYGGSKKDSPKMIQHSGDGGYFVGAISRSFGWVAPDMWFIKLNDNGDSLWTRHYGGNDHEHCHALRSTTDGGFAAVGHGESYGPFPAVMFLKLNPSGKFGPVAVEEYAAQSNFGIYPNPSNGKFVVRTADVKEASIYNSLGSLIYKTAIREPKTEIDISDKPEGIYFISLQSEQGTITRKIVIR